MPGHHPLPQRVVPVSFVPGAVLDSGVGQTQSLLFGGKS